MSKVVNVEEKPSYAESHVGLVKAGGCGEPKLQTPLTLPQFQGIEQHQNLWPARSRTHQGECGRHTGLKSQAAMERKEGQETCPAHIISCERGLITMNSDPEREGGVTNDFIIKAHTYRHS